MSLDNPIIKVLILEDDDADARITSRQLQQSRHTFQIKCVSRMDAAMAYLQDGSFDAVIADVHVPDSTGIATISKLRECSKSTAILAITSVASPEIEDEILAAGAQDFRLKEELCGSALARAVVHAIERQNDLNRIKRLVRHLKRSQVQLRDQAQQLKQKNRHLRKLYRTAREFVDNVSHDLRTPLTVIKDYVSIVRDGMAGEVNPEQVKLLGKVTVRADDLNNMVDDILDASKLEAGLLGAWRRPVSIPEVVSHAASLLRERASIKGIELVIDCPQDLPEAYCDSEKAVRVISNLANNAIKFSKPGDTVLLWAKYQPIEAEILIGVTDHGPGIEQDCLVQIFKRFNQLDNNESSAGKGFGLGLSIAQRLTRINLGQLSVKSEVGKGSTFAFTVPLAEPSEVFWRWLEIRNDSPLPLYVNKVSLGETIPKKDADEFDRFMNCLLRRQDLLFRLSDREWLLVLSIPEAEIPRWEERASRDFARFNRNRPQGALPGYSRRVIQQWPARISARRVLSEFDRILRAEFKLGANEVLSAP
ncbi:hybrid sensor histidine kinase/response regulator [Blastopirellula marina]|uniref:histidine kinase n=1 Tax=Blastopirellula marina TaxID=124 RepID=A0A2S8F9P5_9BACT|nr:hybrid sensor histidine kinase/response regulator [Blastopirellula marina]PQO28886.1 hybrid sensor histidine kinase/response regulator [Blastopirellula marina]PTL42159.1 hybrid sensor histidine kinase/response regulator [Blastopirellula marina]